MTIMLPREALELRGIAALARLIDIAYNDSGQAQRVRRFLLSLYNGPVFPLDMTDLRGLDREIQEDVLGLLAMLEAVCDGCGRKEPAKDAAGLWRTIVIGLGYPSLSRDHGSVDELDEVLVCDECEQALDHGKLLEAVRAAVKREEGGNG